MNPPNKYEQEYEDAVSYARCDSEAPFRNQNYDRLWQEHENEYLKMDLLDPFLNHHNQFQNDIRYTNPINYYKTAKIALPRRLRRSRSEIVKVFRETQPMQKLEVYCQLKSN
mmetsp:Transcript_19428/g.29862  ORF Transcript_19428/g.29862 Transcript_19428/m.29862 type:complete len:112 (-) Transcript_19428:98-433(-)